MPLQKDFSYGVMAVKNIFNIVTGWKMISKERKFSSTVSTSNSGVTQKGVFSCNFYTFSTPKVIVGEKGKYQRGDDF